MRADKYLFFTRFFKTRALAAAMVSGGKLRVDGRRTPKPAQAVGAGDVLTFVQAKSVRVIRITGLPERRGPAAEAQTFYDDLTDPPAAPAEQGA